MKTNMDCQINLNKIIKTIRLSKIIINFPMGLDKSRRSCFNEYMISKVPLDQLGLPASKGGVLGYFFSLFRGRKRRQSPVDLEQEQFEEDVKDQLTELKKKGLNIPIFTL